MDTNVETLASELATTTKEMAEVQAEALALTAHLQSRLNALNEMDKSIREKIKVAMEEHGVKKFENEFISITYVAPSERVGIDATKLRTYHPDLAEKFKKITSVKASVRIKTKGE